MNKTHSFPPPSLLQEKRVKPHSSWTQPRTGLIFLQFPVRGLRSQERRPSVLIFLPPAKLTSRQVYPIGGLHSAQPTEGSTFITVESPPFILLLKQLFFSRCWFSWIDFEFLTILYFRCFGIYISYFLGDFFDFIF